MVRIAGVVTIVAIIVIAATNLIYGLATGPLSTSTVVQVVWDAAPAITVPQESRLAFYGLLVGIVDVVGIAVVGGSVDSCNILVEKGRQLTKRRLYQRDRRSSATQNNSKRET